MQTLTDVTAQRKTLLKLVALKKESVSIQVPMPPTPQV